MPDVLDDILEENARARAALLEAVDAIPAARRLQPSLDGWSVKDIIFHLAAWQDGWAHALECIARGERPSIAGLVEGQNDSFNAARQRETQHGSWEEAMARLRAAREHHEAVARSLWALHPDRYAPGRTARRILSNTALHDHEHIEQILAWRRAQRL